MDQPHAEQCENEHTLEQAIPQPMSAAELGRLFYRQIAVNHIPLIGDNHEGLKKTPAIIRTADRVEMEHDLVQIRGHQLFIFNAFLRLRNQPEGIGFSDVADLGFSPHTTTPKATHSNWSKNVTSLITKINTASDFETIYSSGSGRWRRYFVYPGLEVTAAEDYESESDEFYEFAQEISGPLLRHPSPRTVEVTKETPIDAIIRDDDTIVVNGRATLLNEHDRALLQIITLHEGKPIGIDQLAKVGFHPYATTEAARTSALYRSYHRLNQAFSTDEERLAFFLDSAIHNSSIRALRSYTITDLRPFDQNQPRFTAQKPAFDTLLAQAPRHEKNDTTMPHAELLKRFTIYGPDLLTSAQAYVLSLRFGMPLDSLKDTGYTTRHGTQVNYNNHIAPYIQEGTPVGRALIGKLMGGQGDGSIYSLERDGLQKLQNAGREIEHLRRAGGISRALAEAEDIPPEERLQNYLNGNAIKLLLSLEQRPENERQAVTSHLLPLGTRPPAHKSDLFNGLPWLRRVYKRTMTQLNDAPGLHTLPSLRARYVRACNYFLHVIGSPAEEIRPISFADLAAKDPDFARDGQQLFADVLTVLTAYRLQESPQVFRP